MKKSVLFRPLFADAFVVSSGTTIDDAYVDGVSLTHDSIPRTHIQCPCDGGTPAPDFVHRD